MFVVPIVFGVCPQWVMLVQWVVQVSWWRRLVSVFWWMRLDCFFLVVRATSGGVFWGVYELVLILCSLSANRLCSCLARCLAWGVQNWSLLVVEWSWVLVLRQRSLGKLLPIDITRGLEVSGGPMS